MIIWVTFPQVKPHPAPLSRWKIASGKKQRASWLYIYVHAVHIHTELAKEEITRERSTCITCARLLHLALALWACGSIPSSSRSWRLQRRHFFLLLGRCLFWSRWSSQLDRCLDELQLVSLWASISKLLISLRFGSDQFRRRIIWRWSTIRLQSLHWGTRPAFFFSGMECSL